MYGRTVDDFEYRGVKFRWVQSPNKLIYRVYRDSELIGTIPVVQVRLRHSPEAIKALYPICEGWCDEHGVAPEVAVPPSVFMAEPGSVPAPVKPTQKKQRTAQAGRGANRGRKRA